MPWADLDELLQLGAIGMLEAVQRFDTTRSIDFQAFAARRIRGAMIDGLRRDGALQRGAVHLETEAIDAATYRNGQTPADPFLLLTQSEDKTHLADALRHLPPLEYRVLALHYFEETNNREIAAILGISEGYASRIRKRALAFLAARLTALTQGAPAQ
ncbi:sigma-70 family RNA polymerase sigma factor [Acidisoma silvae]|uniref:Sigma-70 family RNA polymerase sigma factor n=2 Tax=Acidisoma silvae TaxID=2802396 RepID=A0A963YPT3_9PROT|nr:sigma-70 family RNA polymerase sigma factor [Acidisoma silvae]